MDFESAKKKLIAIKQQHVISHWDCLSAEQRQALLQQIDALDSVCFKQQQDLILQQKQCSLAIQPFEDYALANHPSHKRLGHQLINQGKVACLIVAGGQGTRLGFPGPKGMVSVTVLKKKTLFQLAAQKILAASQQAKRPLLAAIMTSPLNDEQTRHYFKKNHNFGLEAGQLQFFSQKMLPFLDKQGNLFLEAPYKIAEGPNGNGDALSSLMLTPIWQEWRQAGVAYINFMQIDNALADPFDAELIGFHVKMEDEITVKCVIKTDPTENVGVLVKKDQKIQVQEYSEMNVSERHALNKDGLLKHRCANISAFCFNGDFLEKNKNEIIDKMPLHAVSKTGSQKEGIWKFEKFIFDVFEFSRHLHALLYEREVCFAPLKNKEGVDSLESVQKALQALDCLTYERVIGVKAPEIPFELPLQFYYVSEN